jgi:hypothetical protein
MRWSSVGESDSPRLIIQSNYLEVVDIIKMEGNSIGVASAIYEEDTFLRPGFSNIKFDYCPRC